MNKKIISRELISYDGFCEFNCKHCFTYDIKEQNKKNRSADEILEDIENKKFDILYISHYNENFYDPMKGLELCEKAFEKFKTHIFIITRNVFYGSTYKRLIDLKNKMNDEGKHLFIGVSIPALNSIDKTEDVSIVPSPISRIEFLKKLYDDLFQCLLVIRPLYPNSYISINEIYKLIELCNNKISGVISSGIAINKSIAKRLNIDFEKLEFLEGNNDNYLIGAIQGDTKYINVKKELKLIANKCSELNIPFFDHSLPALSFLISANETEKQRT